MRRGPDKKPRKVSAWTPERRLAAGSVLRVCEVCGTEFWVKKTQIEKVKGGGRFCSRPCKYEGSVAHKQRRSAEVTRHSAGYLLQWAPDHPRAIRGRVLQHILIVEAALGRSLAEDEEVHHVNGVRDDNRTENLEVLKRGAHQALHWQDPTFREAQSKRVKREYEQRKREGGIGPDGRFLPR